MDNALRGKVNVGCVSVSVTHEFLTLDEVGYISLTTKSAIELTKSVIALRLRMEFSLTFFYIQYVLVFL